MIYQDYQSANSLENENEFHNEQYSPAQDFTDFQQINLKEDEERKEVDNIKLLYDNILLDMYQKVEDQLKQNKYINLTLETQVEYSKINDSNQNEEDKKKIQFYSIKFEIKIEVELLTIKLMIEFLIKVSQLQELYESYKIENNIIREVFIKNIVLLEVSNIELNYSYLGENQFIGLPEAELNEKDKVIKEYMKMLNNYATFKFQKNRLNEDSNWLYNVIDCLIQYFSSLDESQHQRAIIQLNDFIQKKINESKFVPYFGFQNICWGPQGQLNIIDSNQFANIEFNDQKNSEMINLKIYQEICTLTQVEGYLALSHLKFANILEDKQAHYQNIFDSKNFLIADNSIEELDFVVAGDFLNYNEEKDPEMEGLDFLEYDVKLFDDNIGQAELSQDKFQNKRFQQQNDFFLKNKEKSISSSEDQLSKQLSKNISLKTQSKSKKNAQQFQILQINQQNPIQRAFINLYNMVKVAEDVKKMQQKNDLLLQNNQLAYPNRLKVYNFYQQDCYYLEAIQFFIQQQKLDEEGVFQNEDFFINLLKNIINQEQLKISIDDLTKKHFKSFDKRFTFLGYFLKNYFQSRLKLQCLKQNKRKQITVLLIAMLFQIYIDFILIKSCTINVINYFFDQNEEQYSSQVKDCQHYNCDIIESMIIQFSAQLDNKSFILKKIKSKINKININLEFNGMAYEYLSNVYQKLNILNKDQMQKIHCVIFNTLELFKRNSEFENFQIMSQLLYWSLQMKTILNQLDQLVQKYNFQLQNINEKIQKKQTYNNQKISFQIPQQIENSKSNSMRCVICKMFIKGLALMCSKCYHAYHFYHFKDLDNLPFAIDCPKCINCKCFEQIINEQIFHEQHEHL